jgi:hypothetical protein
MAFHLLWGCVLGWSISKYGLGISTDSVHQLFGALNLAAGRGLFSFDGGFLLTWPPLYPALLAFIQILTRQDPFLAAEILQICAFAGTSVCLALLYLNIFPGNFLLALAGNILSDIGAVVLTAFGVVGSDYLHICLVLAYLLLCAKYVQARSGRSFVGLSAVGMLVMLERYLGIAAIAAGTALVCLHAQGGWRKGMVPALFTALSALPGTLWWVITSRLLTSRAPVSFADNFRWFSTSVLQWFFSVDAKGPYIWLWIALLWLVLASALFLAFRLRDRSAAPAAFVSALLYYSIFYTLSLFGAASIEYFNKLEGRFLLPLYLPSLLLVALLAGELWTAAAQRTAGRKRGLALGGICMALALTAVGLLRITLPIAWASHTQAYLVGNDFNNEAWHANDVMRYWLANPPTGNYRLLSNYPDGVAFYTWRPVSASPVRHAGPYAQAVIPLTEYRSELFSPGQDIYVIWIEPNIHPYYYGPQDLTAIANIEALFESPDGGVYRLTPAAAGP